MGENNSSSLVSAKSLKRWTGHKSSAEHWDSSMGDPELWTSHGDCLIYLQNRFEPDQTPCFRLAIADLMAAQCQTLIEQSSAYERDDAHLVNNGSHASRTALRIYITPEQTGLVGNLPLHYIAIRNFLAWVTGKSLVSEHLGPTFVLLLQTMQRLRPQGLDSTADLLIYLKRLGFLDLADRPTNALALLYLAEHAQLSDLYIRAFSHCVGMGDYILSSPDFSKSSVRSRKLIEAARKSMAIKLSSAAAMLDSFLDNELSETYLGLPPESRAHMDRFRSFLLSFYTSKMGYYPPRKFSWAMLNAMCHDFEALYDLLVDGQTESTSAVPSFAAGGICTLQVVQTFDTRHQLQPRRKLLPLIPQLTQSESSKRSLWSLRSDRAKPSSALLSHTALIKASNWQEGLFKNELVRAYRDFEARTVVSNGGSDKREKLSLIDGRKVRWILIYTTCQILRNVTASPSQVRAEQTSYHLAVSSDNLPPWNTPPNPNESSTQPDAPGITASHKPENTDEAYVSDRIELKPDIDYYALTHQQSPTRVRSSTVAAPTERQRHFLPRSVSVTRVLTRSSTFRQSMRMLKPKTPTAGDVAWHGCKPVRHQSVVQEYGTGTNYDNSDDGAPAADVQLLATRSLSVASKSNSSAASSAYDSMASTVDMLDLNRDNSTPGSPLTEFSPDSDQIYDWPGEENKASQPEPIRRNSSCRSLLQLSPLKTMIGNFSHSPSIKSPTSPERPKSVARDSFGFNMPARTPSLRMPELRRRSILPNSLSASPHMRQSNIEERREDEDEAWDLQADVDDWNAMQAFLDGDGSAPNEGAETTSPAWEQYADLGGLRMC